MNNLSKRETLSHRLIGLIFVAAAFFLTGCEEIEVVDIETSHSPAASVVANPENAQASTDSL